MGQFARQASAGGPSNPAPSPDWGSETPAHAAHDFGNMLQVATSALRMTRRRLTADGNLENAAVLGDVLDALDRATYIAQRVLTRSPPGRASRPVLVQSTIPSLGKLLRHALGDAIRLRIAVPEDLPPVMCDPRQFDDALLNLAVNARDAMPSGGELLIEARACSAPAHGSRCVLVDIIDSGCGMPPEVVERAFRPFFTTKGPDQGTGLGLTAVRNFVEQWGGSVEIESAEARGTRVRLHLPANGTA